MPKVSPWSVVRAVLLALVAFLLACAFTGRWTARDWQTPIEYGVDGPASDARSVFCVVKVAAEGHYPLVLSKNVPEFGAPYVANWNDYPSIEEILVVIPGIFARFMGVFAAVNLIVILAHVTSALGFYLACRLLNYRWEWSFAGALIFGFAAYLFARSIHHFSLAWVGHVPLIVVAARWAFARDGTGGGLADRSHFRWALGIAAITGIQNVYYTNALMQFLAIATLCHFFRKEWKSALRTIAVGTVAVSGFVVMNLDTFWGRIVHGPNPLAVMRNYQHLEFYGFKLADLFITPPNYWISPLAHWGEMYFAGALLKGEVPPGSYLGVAGIAAFFALVGVSLWSLGRETVKRPPWEAFLLAWLVTYATVGGLNGWLGSLGFVLFRSTTRYTIFILALVLMYAVKRLGLLTAKWGAAERAVVAMLVAVVALWDQVPRAFNEDQAQVAAAVHSDRTFAEAMEAGVKPNAMVFQLPVMNFPESPAPGVGSSDHFRPFFYTKTLRYSFGAMKGRPESAWQREMALLPPETLMQRLESFGFGALYINSAGFADRGRSYLDAAAKRGSKVITSPAGDLSCVFLNPSASPVFPPPPPLFGKGWYEPENDGAGHEQRLCQGRGEIVLTNSGTEPVERRLQFLLQGVDNRKVRIVCNGASLGEAAVQPGRYIRVSDLKITLRPGQNTLVFEADRPAAQTMRGPVGFGIMNFEVTEGPLAAGAGSPR